MILLLVKNVILFTGIIENITEFRPELCVEVAKQGFIQWILKRLKVSVDLCFAGFHNIKIEIHIYYFYFLDENSI